MPLPPLLPAPAVARSAARPVLLFDGECGLCQACVRMLIRLDPAGRLRFAPLQGAPAQAYLRAQGLPVRDFDTLVFVPEWNRPAPGDYRLRTDGLLAACAVVGAVGRELANLRALPASFRDLIYRAVARSRYALFGAARPERWSEADRARLLAD